MGFDGEGIALYTRPTYEDRRFKIGWIDAVYRNTYVLYLLLLYLYGAEAVTFFSGAG
jgi:hypothetical protein